jgi:hypothetical protein
VNGNNKLFYYTDTCSPTGVQMASFLSAFAQCQELDTMPDVPMEDLSLVQVSLTSFKDCKATLVGIDQQMIHVHPEDVIKSLFDAQSIKIKFQHRSQGISVQLFWFL